MFGPVRSALEALAEELAGELLQGAGARAFELMQCLGCAPGAFAATAGPPGAANAPHAAHAAHAAHVADTTLPPRIGVWELVSLPGDAAGEGASHRYQRVAASPGTLDAWADVPAIERKGSRRRVILVGESVARGFFYDPCYTPAQVLEALLASAAVPGGVEVVDLARTALTAQGLAELAGSCMALEPDALVIFAGNNWNIAPQVFGEGVERALVASVLRRQGVAGFSRFLAGRTADGIEALFRTALAPLAGKLPVCFLVPGSNLADWRPQLAADVPLLPADGTERWLRLRSEACDALAAGRPEAASLARRMLELDAGTAATAWSILAAVARREGRVEEARDLLERARDARNWDSVLRVPGLSAGDRQVLRRSALAAGIELIELPELFEQAAGGLPGRDLFLDYCHLSAHGIRIAMAAAAERLLPALGASPACREELLTRALQPAAELEAEAHFAAAIHNAHWGQGGEIVGHHCRLAAGSPQVARIMRDYVDLQVGHAPSWASVAAERLSARGASPLARLAPWRELFFEDKLFDAILLDAVAAALEERGDLEPGDFSLRARLLDLRLAERGLEPARGVDLLDPYNLPSHAVREGLWYPQHFFRAYADVSRFPLVANGAAPVAFELTLRQGGGAGDADGGALLVNGIALGPLPMSDRWTTRRFLAPAASLRPGVNWIEVRWPPRLPPAAAALDDQARRIEQGRPYCLLPVRGEIHTFTAALADGRDPGDQGAERAAA
ncbi:MAG TPA: hypothetical protein VKY89_15705 [Thermoanaerobaculia bacterium]|nr:hypothetical protein [Thermoanaerobaculia bacterium]